MGELDGLSYTEIRNDTKHYIIGSEANIFSSHANMQHIRPLRHAVDIIR
jgi:hypothetical protein